MSAPLAFSKRGLVATAPFLRLYSHPLCTQASSYTKVGVENIAREILLPIGSHWTAIRKPRETSYIVSLRTKTELHDVWIRWNG
jgi:hypothetical protein